MAVTNALRQFVRSLHQGKHRRLERAFLVEGRTNVEELLKSKLECQHLFLTSASLEQMQIDADFRFWLSKHPDRVHEIGQAELERLSTQKQPHGALAVAAQASPPFSEDDDEAVWLPVQWSRILYLDGLNDPGNLGTIIRTAEWVGFDAVLSAPGSVDWYNPKVVAAARGSLFRMPHGQLSLSRLATQLEKYPLIMADLDGVEVQEFAWPKIGILLIGSESHGPSAEAKTLLSRAKAQAISIPRGSDRTRTESLNAALAAGILMFSWQSRG